MTAMAAKKRKPTRRDLLLVIGRLQQKVGRAMGANNDRNPNSYAETRGVLQEALELCIEVRSCEPSVEGKLGPWGYEPPPRSYQ